MSRHRPSKEVTKGTARSVVRAGPATSCRGDIRGPSASRRWPTAPSKNSGQPEKLPGDERPAAWARLTPQELQIAQGRGRTDQSRDRGAIMLGGTKALPLTSHRRLPPVPDLSPNRDCGEGSHLRAGNRLAVRRQFRRGRPLGRRPSPTMCLHLRRPVDCGPQSEPRVRAEAVLVGTNDLFVEVNRSYSRHRLQARSRNGYLQSFAPQTTGHDWATEGVFASSWTT